MAISNSSLFPVSPNNQSKWDRYSINGSKQVKVGAISSKYTFLIIWFYWPDLCFFGIEVNICADNNIRKTENNLNTGTINADKADKSSTSIAYGTRANNLGIDIGNIVRTDSLDKRTVDKNGVINSGIDIEDVDGLNKSGKDIKNADGADKPDIIDIDKVDYPDTTDAKKTENLDITDIDKENKSRTSIESIRQNIISNAVHVSLFFLCRALFLWSLLLN